MSDSDSIQATNLNLDGGHITVTAGFEHAIRMLDEAMKSSEIAVFFRAGQHGDFGPYVDTGEPIGVNPAHVLTVTPA